MKVNKIFNIPILVIGLPLVLAYGAAELRQQIRYRHVPRTRTVSEGPVRPGELGEHRFRYSSAATNRRVLYTRHLAAGEMPATRQEAGAAWRGIVHFSDQSRWAVNTECACDRCESIRASRRIPREKRHKFLALFPVDHFLGEGDIIRGSTMQTANAGGTVKRTWAQFMLVDSAAEQRAAASGVQSTPPHTQFAEFEQADYAGFDAQAMGEPIAMRYAGSNVPMEEPSDAYTAQVEEAEYEVL